MTWLLVILLAGAAFACAVLLLRLPRAGWTLLGAALLFGLAGYALQGSPSLPAAPARLQPRMVTGGEELVAARREFFPATALPARHVVTADAFARQGRWRDAAGFLSNALGDNPRDGEAWTALGIALAQVAEGRMTPAAQLAFARAGQTPDGALAAAYFSGLGRLAEEGPLVVRAQWADALERAPADAPGRAILVQRLERLDLLLAAMAAQGEAPVQGPVAGQ